MRRLIATLPLAVLVLAGCAAAGAAGNSGGAAGISVSAPQVRSANGANEAVNRAAEGNAAQAVEAQAPITAPVSAPVPAPRGGGLMSRMPRTGGPTMGCSTPMTGPGRAIPMCEMK